MRKLILFFCLLLVSLNAWAAPARKMLVLYKSSEKINPNDYEVKWHLEPILAQQGWKLTYVDCDKGLPDDVAMADYQGVCSWHRTAVYKDPTSYVRWMRTQVVSGRKIVVFGNFGAYTSDQKTWLGNEVLNEFFLPFGLEYGAAYSGDSKQLQVAGNSKATPPSPLSYYLLFRSSNPDNDPWLTIRRKDLEKSDSALVVVTPKGAMVGETYAYQMQGKKIQWLVDRSKLLSQALAAPAQDRVSGGGHILALYKSSEGYDDTSNYVARFLAPILKELGYTYDSYDILKGLPSPAIMGKYSGVISWYQTASMENAHAYCDWLAQQIMAGRKVVVIGNLGAFQELDKQSNPPTERWLLPNEYNSFLFPFGLEFKGTWTKDSSILKVVSRDPLVIPFLEQQYIAHYYWIQSVNPENKPYLVLSRSDQKNSDSAIVVRTPYGGLALESYLFRDMTGKGDYRWHVDMKRFLGDCLTYKPSKLPVATTLKVTPTTPKQITGANTLPSVPALPAGTTEIKRRVLAFYQREQKEFSEKNRIHDNVETFLNHLGLVVDYRAIEDPLPSAAEMEQYRGVITWLLGASVPNAQAYGGWLKAQADAGRKVVILGDYGAYQDKSLTTQVDPTTTFKALGIDWRAASPVSGIRINRANLVSTSPPSIEYMDPDMCKGEHPINLEDKDLKKGWPVYLSSNPANKVYLKVKDPEGQICDAVTITPYGGIVAGEFLLYVPPAVPFSRTESADPNRSGPAVADEVELPELRIDAFRFFAEAFQTNDLPRCDVTTLNGSRIFFTHIDGDAMQGMSLIDRGSLNAEMLYREIFQVYQIPTSVSFVTDNLKFKATPTYKRELEAARRILALPWVEADCHTVYHPFNWRLGDLKRKPGDTEGGLVRIPPDNRMEICDALDFTNQLVCPPGKKTRTLFWSGMCNPSEEALMYTDGMGVSNLNGGDPVYDSIHPFLVGVSPLYAQVGGRYQFHTCAAGDFYYTGAWTKDYDGMKRLVEYFNYTEEPRRLRAMNLYYHFYLAERELGITGLKIAMDWVMAHQPAYLFASNYVDIVRDMIVTRLGRDAQGNIVVSNGGTMRTIRFDDVKQRPDMTKSSGVLGYNVAGNRLYVHLDDANLHRITLADNPANNRPYVERASHYINGWKVSGGNISFSFKGTGPASISLLGMDKSAGYKVSFQGQPDKVVRSDANGRLLWDGTLANYEGTYSVKINKQ